MSGELDNEKVKREEERLLRAMSRKKNQLPVFGKQVSTDTMRKQEEEEKKRKEQEQKLAKQREDLERKRQEAVNRQPEIVTATPAGAPVAPPIERAISFKESRDAFVQLAEVVPDQRALQKEEQRMNRINSQKSIATAPAATTSTSSGKGSLQAHLQKLQEAKKVDEAPAPAPTPTPAPAPTPAATPAPAVSHEPAPVTVHSTPSQVVSPRGAKQAESKTDPNRDPAYFPPAGPPTIGGPFEIQVLEELNEVRTNPQKYANYLRTLAGNFDGLLFQVPNTRFGRQTKEGVAALNEAVNFLSGLSPIPPLRPVETLSKVARDLIEEDAQKKQLTDATTYERFSRYGRWDGELAEMTSFGGVSAKEVVYQWLVDDGSPDRRDRRSIVQPQFRVIGISSGYHAEYGRICVATLTSDYRDRDGEAKEAPSTPNVSLIKEEDGHVTINGGATPGDKSRYRLVKKGKRLTLTSSEVNRSWDLPFDFHKDSVIARIDNTGHLLIEISKGADTPVDTEALLVAPAFTIGGSAGAGEKIQLAVRQDSDFIYVDICPSKFDEEVFVRTRGNAVEIESKHTEIEQTEGQTVKKGITSVQTLQLPFKPTGINVNITPQPLILINKKSTGVAQQYIEEEIPIF